MTQGAVQFDVRLAQSRSAVWELLTDTAQLSAWLGGPCELEPRVGGRASFQLPQDGVAASGVVRQCDPPDEAHAVAGLRHTFIDARWPQVVSECAWWVVDRPDGCELHFRQDGFGEIEAGAMTQVWGARFAAQPGGVAGLRRTHTVEQAQQLLRAARSVLLVSFIGLEAPTALLEAGFEVFAKTGPGEADWARAELRDGAPHFVPMAGPPAHVDLVHLDWELAFDDSLELAARLGAVTYWTHSARTEPPAPADNRGTWTPAPQSERQRRLTEARGLAYIDDHYIADVARSLSSGKENPRRSGG